MGIRRLLAKWIAGRAISTKFLPQIFEQFCGKAQVDVDYLWIKLCTRTALNHIPSSIEATTPPMRTITCNNVQGVGNSKYPCTEGNLRGVQSTRIARTVIVLMMGIDHIRDFGEEWNFSQSLIAALTMRSQESELFVRQLDWLR